MIGTAIVDTDARTISISGVMLKLPALQYRILSALIINHGIALSRDKLLELSQSEAVDWRAIDVHILRIRRTLEYPAKLNLETVYSVGYMWRVHY